MIPSLKQASTTYQSSASRLRSLTAEYAATISLTGPTSPASHSAPPDSTVSFPSGRLATNRPRSTSGSPIVAISQSSTAATRGSPASTSRLPK